jgi:hypothetical protein
LYEKKNWALLEKFYAEKYSPERNDGYIKSEKEAKALYLLKKADFERIEDVEKNVYKNFGRIYTEYKTVERLYVTDENNPFKN